MAAIIQKYRGIINKLKAQSPEILEQALEPVFAKSQEYCPVDTGSLINSGRLSSGKRNGKAVAYITYGDSIAWYAAIVHERTDLNHASPTRAKFLQSALEEEFDNFLVSLAMGYATVLRS
jgi:hypothetical protein